MTAALDPAGNIGLTGVSRKPGRSQGANQFEWDYLDYNAWHILKYDSDGILLWSRTGEHDCLHQISRAIAVDGWDNIYISRYCQNSACSPHQILFLIHSRQL